MLIQVVKSKIHRVKVTQADLNYIGSIKGDSKSGTICLNGPAARRVAKDDLIIIIGYGYMDFEEAKSFKPSLVFPNEETNLLD